MQWKICGSLYVTASVFFNFVQFPWKSKTKIWNFQNKNGFDQQQNNEQNEVTTVDTSQSKGVFEMVNAFVNNSKNCFIFQKWNESIVWHEWIDFLFTRLTSMVDQCLQFRWSTLRIRHFRFMLIVTMETGIALHGCQPRRAQRQMLLWIRWVKFYLLWLFKCTIRIECEKIWIWILGVKSFMFIGSKWIGWWNQWMEFNWRHLCERAFIYSIQ